MTKNKILGFFEDTSNFERIEKNLDNDSKYHFEELNASEIAQLKNIILDLEGNNDAIVCTRGWSK